MTLYPHYDDCTTLQCTACGQWADRDEFYWRTRKRRYRVLVTSQCRACYLKTVSAWKDRHRARVRLYGQTRERKLHGPRRARSQIDDDKRRWLHATREVYIVRRGARTPSGGTNGRS